MKIQFRADITTTVSTCALIENRQNLIEAIEKCDWELVQTVADCLADAITDRTFVPEGLDIEPSGASLVLMQYESGIILGADGKDLKCAVGIPVSKTMCAECCQCDEECQERNGCYPEIGRINLGNGNIFNASSPTQGESLIMLERMDEQE